MGLFEEVLAAAPVEGEIKINRNLSKVDRPIFEIVDVQKFKGETLTPLMQFYIAPFITYDPNFVCDIPVSKPEIFKIALNEIAPHFEKVRVVRRGEETSLVVRNLKEESKLIFDELLKEGALNELVSDLYGSKHDDSQDDNFTEYKVNLAEISTMKHNDSDSIIDFLKESTQDILLSPHNWLFENDFKEHIATRILANVCNSMKVTVNSQKNKIVWIEVGGLHV
ncbi:hypothetical protein [Paenibacillus terrae]|uniref:hypothetical protein n=1 Tax=Paenibacillus terrae TaxID=159743 RepID=UPI0011EB7EC1|nr:hypothetical protein [Paenibacillus terrae]